MFNAIVMIAGVARSGTTWLGEILNSSPEVAYRFQPLFSYAFKDRVGIASRRSEYETFLKDVYESDDAFILQTEEREKGILPTFCKAKSPHLLAMKNARYHYLLIRFLGYFEDLKLLAIVRNPCAVIASWAENPKEFPAGSNLQLEWRFGACKNQCKEENFFGFYKWRESTNLFIDLKSKFPDRVHLVRYEDLCENPMRVAKHIFDFVCLDFTDQTKNFIRESRTQHSDSPYSVYKGGIKRDGWHEKLDPRIAKDIEQELIGTRLEKFLK